jgi:hypothetical protein
MAFNKERHVTTKVYVKDIQIIRAVEYNNIYPATKRSIQKHKLLNF